jgi:hypothetical protein
MLANTKRLKNKLHELRLPWWFNLVKLGIPYTLAATTSVMVMLALGGWVAMPESIQMLKWVEALFMAMSPAVKFLAVSLTGLGSFLSTLAITSVFVRGFLFGMVEKSASEGIETVEQLLEQTKELQQNIAVQAALIEQYKTQSEFLKGYATVLKDGENYKNRFSGNGLISTAQSSQSTNAKINSDLEWSSEIEEPVEQQNIEQEDEDKELRNVTTPEPSADLEELPQEDQELEEDEPSDTPIPSRHPEPVLFGRAHKADGQKHGHRKHKVKRRSGSLGFVFKRR